MYKDGQLEAQDFENSRDFTVKPGGWAVLGQTQETTGDDFEASKAFSGELAEVNLWDTVLSDADIAAQYRNCYIPHGSVIQWPQFEAMGELEIKQYSCTLTRGKPN